MPGAVLMIIALVVVLPVLVLITMAIVAAILGSVANHDSAEQHEGSELTDIW